MNLNEQYFLVLRGPKRKPLKIAGRYETAAGADRAGQAQPKDYDVERGDRLAELGVATLVALYNAMAAKRDQVATFDSAERGAQRLVHMYTMANGGEYDEPPREADGCGPTAAEVPTTSAPTGAEETTMAKKKAKAAKAPKAKKANKMASGAAVPAKAKKSDGPREGSIAHFIVGLLNEGRTVEQVADAAGKKFPDSQAGDKAYVSWHRWSAGKKGWLKKAAQA